jgi:PAS domain S-box-containing protein
MGSNFSKKQPVPGAEHPRYSRKARSPSATRSGPRLKLQSEARSRRPVAGGLRRREGKDAAGYLSAIVESSEDAIFSENLEGLITTWNKAAERIFGYRAEEVIGEPVSLIVEPEQVREQVAIRARIRQGERVEHYETTRLRKDGSRIEVSLTASPIKDSRGRIIGASKIARDITERKRMERQAADLLERNLAHEKVQESETRFRSLADDSPMIIWMADENANATYGNRALLELLGLDSFTAFSGRLWEHFVHPDDVARTHDIYRRAVEEQRPYALEIRLRDAATGEFRWHMVKGVPRFVAGQFTGFVGTGVDIHDRRLAEEKLRRSGERYRTLFNSIDEGFCIIEVLFDGKNTPIDYRFLDVNPAFEKHTGLTQAQGKSMRQLAPQHEDYWFETYGRIALTGEPVRFQNHAAQLGRWYDVYAFRFGDPASHQVAVLFNDISARCKTQMELQHVREELSRRAADLEKAVHERTADLLATIAELESVSYSLSHDMRAPLRTIRSFTEIVLNEAGDKLEAAEQRLLQKSISAAGRLDRLIQDVLTYSRVARELVSLHSLNVEPLLRQIIEERPELQPPNALIEIEGLIEPVRGHEAYLTQCLTNLLDNAVKFVVPGTRPRVRIWSELLEDQVQLWFEDNGIGIPEHAQERIFAIFQRVHDEKTYPGTGIGLAIVRKAVQRMGGAVGVESKPGRGSRFWLRLPRGE